MFLPLPCWFAANLDPLAIAGAGTAMGVAGYQIVEIFLRHMRRKLGEKENKEE